MATATATNGKATNGKATNGKHAAGPVPRNLSTQVAKERGQEVVRPVERVDPERYLPKLVTMLVTIKGVSPLLVENFNTKTKNQMLAKHKGEAQEKKAAKNVEELFRGSKYLDARGKDCFPCGPIRAAIIGATRLTDTEKMTTLKQAIFVEHPKDSMSDLLPLSFSKCLSQEDVTRNANGQPDIRIRACYYDWKLTFRVNAVQHVLSTEQLLQLISHAGLGGIGGWRPSGKKGLGGIYGRFEIDSIE
jgi:hypothetical protein